MTFEPFYTNALIFAQVLDNTIPKNLNASEFFNNLFFIIKLPFQPGTFGEKTFIFLLLTVILSFYQVKSVYNSLRAFCR